MSFWTSAWAVLTGGPLTVANTTITAGELKAGLAGLQKLNLADMQNAVNAKLANVPDDFVVAEDILTIAGDFGLPDTALAIVAVKALAWIVAHNRSAEPGALVHIANGNRGTTGLSH